MKEIYISDILDRKDVCFKVAIKGWLKNRRHIGKILFIDICDSTGSIQAVINHANVTHELFHLAKRTPLESAIEIFGVIQEKNDQAKELYVDNFVVISLASK